MSTERQLQAAALRHARLIEVMNQSFAEELEQVLKLATRQIRDLIRQLETDANRISREASLGRVLQMQTDIRDALRIAGFDELVARVTDAPLDRIAIDLMRSSASATRAAELTAVNIDALAAFKTVRLSELLRFGDDIAEQLWRTTIDGALGVRRPEDLIADLEDLLDSSQAEAHTIYDTALSTYSREVDQLGTSGDADELFVYVGPDDDVTREFCAERVGEVYPRSEIDDMDNQQLPNVMLTGGGYNCRHSWKPVSLLDSDLRRQYEAA